jgi:Predicted esterase
MSSLPLGFVHHFQPAAQTGVTAPTLLLLHGTGGNENDLLDLGPVLAPQANLLSPRGNVLEAGMPRFFRRLSEGVFDQEDLRYRTDELADFITKAAETYGFDRQHIVAVGYSNGANIAGSLLLRHPGLLKGAILFRPMVPFEPDPLPNLIGTALFIASGRLDPLIPMQEAERCAALFKQVGAEVTLTWYLRGHNLGYDEVQNAKLWLEQHHVLA